MGNRIHGKSETTDKGWGQLWLVYIILCKTLKSFDTSGVFLLLFPSVLKPGSKVLKMAHISVFFFHTAMCKFPIIIWEREMVKPSQYSQGDDHWNLCVRWALYTLLIYRHTEILTLHICRRLSNATKIPHLLPYVQ